MKHSESIQKLCIVCLRYLGKRRERETKQYFRALTQKLAVVVSQYIPEYTFNDPKWPAMVCHTCRIIISCNMKSHLIRQRLRLTDYSAIISSRVSRSNTNNCNCHVCQIVSKHQPHTVTPKRKQTKKKKSVPLCSECLFPLVKGKRHLCNTRTLADRVFEISQQRKCSDVVLKRSLRQKKAAASGTEEIKLKNMRGKPSKIFVYSKKQVIPSFDTDDIIEIHKDQSNSTRKSIRLVQKLRKKGCKIQKNVFTEIDTLADEVRSFFCVEKVLVECGDKKNKTMETRDLAYCNRLKEFINFISHKRKFEPDDNLLIKFGCDSGGGSLKLAMTVSLKDDPKERDKGYLYTGVKKTFILAIAYDTSETHNNVALIFHKLELTDFTVLNGEVWFSSDLKMYNKSLGLMDYSSLHPCSFCTMDKTSIQNGDTDFEWRTFGGIRENNKKWIEKGSNLKRACDFENCVCEPALTGVPDEARVIDYYAIPELHEMTGIFNHLINTFKKVDPDGIENWIKRVGTIAEGRSGTFNGNSSRKLMEKRHLLKEYLHDSSTHYFIDLIGSFNYVVDACFGYQLAENYSQVIEHFAWLIKIHKVPITPKIHILLNHAPQFIEENNKGLGYFSEQQFESVHHVWSEHFENYKINSKNDNFVISILNGLSKFNSLNL